MTTFDEWWSKFGLNLKTSHEIAARAAWDASRRGYVSESQVAIERAIMERLQKEIFNGEAPDHPHDRYARGAIQEMLNNYPGGVCYQQSISK